MSDKKLMVMVTYSFDSNLGDCYSIVMGDDYYEARSHISKVTNNEFAFTYTDEDDIKRQIKEYNLKQVDLQPQIRVY